MKTTTRPITDLSQDPANARTHDERNLATITASLRRFGQQKPIVVDTSGVVRAGNGTLAAAASLGWDTVEVVETDLQGSEATAYAIADNRTAELAGWDSDVLAATLGAIAADDPDLLAAAGYDADELAAMQDELFSGDGDAASSDQGVTLAERFGVPPFSVLDARQGYWQDRKRAWLAMGIQSELGRGGGGIIGGAPLPLDRQETTLYASKKARGDGRGRPMK